MVFNNKYLNKILIFIPAIVAFFIALIPTLTYQWPLTLDIFDHIHIAHVYSQYGLTLIDPLIDPPKGSAIGYPPLFSLIIMFLGNMLKIDYFQVARLLQPVLAFSVVLSVSYVAKKFYGQVASISAGFLLMSSYLFSRLVSPLPETMALIFVPLAVYFYYNSVENKNYLYALLAGIMFLVVVATHQATTLVLFLVITSIALVTGILRKDSRFFTSYIMFLVIPLILALLAAFSLVLLAPSFVNNILTQGLQTITGYVLSLPLNDPISNLKYVAYLGILLIFAVIGGIIALKKRRTQDIIIFTWILVVFLISKAYWFGVNVYSIRLLVHLLLPFSILGGFGVSYLYEDFKKREFNSKTVRSVFLISVFIISSFYGITTVEDPNLGVLPKYNAFVYGNGTEIPQLTPPTASEVDLAQWFSKNRDNKSVVMSNNYYVSYFILTMTGQPIAGVLSSEHCLLWGFKKQELTSKKVGYFVYDKRLTFTSPTNFRPMDGGTFIFYNKDKDFKQTAPNYVNLVYENKDYVIYKII